MYFKLSYTIQQCTIHNDEEIFFLEDSNIEVRMYRPSEEDIAKGTKQNSIYCDAIIETEPNSKNAELLKKIINREVLGFGETESDGYIISENIIRKSKSKKSNPKESKKYFVPRLDVFPEHFKTFHTKQNNILSEAIRRVTNNTMWVYNYNGSHKPFGSRGFSFSIDKKKWQWMPTSIQVTVSVGPSAIRISENGRNIISSKNTNVPIHHSLFLEAWNQKSTNERSALIMGVASLEGAVKHMVATNIPDASWMIENSPSPPIHSMLGEMLKNIPLKHEVEGKGKSLSKETLDNIRKWVNVRNQLIHIGGHLPKSFQIKNILLTIKSIIYLMDYYSGEKWAIHHIDKSLLEASNL